MTPRFNSHMTAQLLAADEWRREAMALARNAHLAHETVAAPSPRRRRLPIRARLALALIALGRRLSPGVVVVHSHDTRLSPSR